MKSLKTILPQTNKQKLLSAFTFVVLVLLMIIQVDYIQKAAHLEEQNFNHRAMMALKDTRDEVARRAPSCNDMQNYLSGFECPERAKQKAAAEVDSILRSNLKLYQIDVAYTLQISDTLLTACDSQELLPSCYLQNINGILKKKGIQMRLEFPDRNQFMIKQMSGLFVLSILFIGFVMVSYILTQRMSVRVKKQMQRTQEFINNMVHEFQTPLANMRFAANLIKKKNEGEQSCVKIDNYTKIILAENQKMEDHVQDILKVACARTTSCENTLNLHQVIKKVVDDFQFSFEQNKGSVKLELSAANDLIKADERELERVISNLLDNAIKYAKENPTVYIRTSNKGVNLLLQVMDKGIGIDQNELPRIFDQYYRVSTGDVHNVKGFGLGLTYVKKIVEKYGGKVSVKSKPAEETTFLIQMPLISGF